MPRFVIIYIPSNVTVTVEKTKEGLKTSGEKWQVDTDEDGSVVVFDDLEIALDRVKHIRERGGEACLTVVLE